MNARCCSNLDCRRPSSVFCGACNAAFCIVHECKCQRKCRVCLDVVEFPDISNECMKCDSQIQEKLKARDPLFCSSCGYPVYFDNEHCFRCFERGRGKITMNGYTSSPRDDRFWSAVTYILLALLVVGAFSLFACGKQTDVPISPKNNEPVTVYVWIAPWCSTCKNVAPLIDQAAFDKRSVTLKYLVPTGELAPNQPNADTTAQYAKSLGLKAMAQNDEWRWTEYRKFFSSGTLLPAVVVLDQDGKVLHSYRNSLLQHDVVGYLNTKQ